MQSSFKVEYAFIFNYDDDFETDLRKRLAQRVTSNQSEEAILLRSFKFFDLTNTGYLGKSEFLRGLAKAGLIFSDVEQQDKIFQIYDVDQKNQVDYKQFIKEIVFSPNQMHNPTSPFIQQQKSGAEQQIRQQVNTNDITKIKEHVDKLKQRLIQKGSSGLINLAQQFQLEDKQRKGLININSFNKAVRDCRLQLDYYSLENIFEFLDGGKSGSIQYQQLISIIKGPPMSQFRVDLLLKIFDRFNYNQTGVLQIGSLKQYFVNQFGQGNLPKNPETEQKIKDFLNAVDSFLEFKGIRDNKLTIDDFQELYSFFNYMYEKDQQFEQSMNQVWNLSDLNTKPQQSYHDSPKSQANYNQNQYSPISQKSQQSYPKQQDYQQKVQIPPYQQQQQSSLMQQQQLSQQQLQQYQQQPSQYQQQQLPQYSQQQQDLAQQQQWSQQQRQMESMKPPASPYLPKQKNEDQYNKSVSNYRQSPKSEQSGYNYDLRMENITQRQIELIMQRIKKRLASRGPKGFLGMQRQFKVLDLDNDQGLNLIDFKKGVRDNRIDVTDTEIEIIFGIFDKNDFGLINYIDFLTALKGDISQCRVEIINQVFQKLDTNQDSIITIAEFKQGFVAREHPDAKTTKRSEEEIVFEFVDALELNHYLNGNYQSQEITKQEFFQFFHNVSAAIQEDKLFETIFISCFKLSHENALYQNYAGSRNKFDPNHKIGFLQDHHRHLIYGGTVSQNAPFGTFDLPTEYYQKDQSRPQTAQSSTNPSVRGSPYKQQQKQSQYDIFNQERQQYQVERTPLNQQQQQQKGNIFSQQEQQICERELQELIFAIRQKVASRGARGFIGLLRQLKIQDRELEQKINLYNFLKVFKDLRIDVKETEIKSVFEYLDQSRIGYINYEQFFQIVKGQMNVPRRNVVLNVFELLDNNKIGEVNIEDIRNLYNARRHPDVESGKQLEEEQLGQFLDSFELLHQLRALPEFVKQGRVQLQQFLEYYECVSASIGDDQLFDRTVKGCWSP